MPNVLSIPVPNGSSAVAWASRNPGVSTLLFVNSDLVNTVYVGSQSNITPTSPNVVPILPNGTFSGDAQENWYVTGAAAGISPLVVVPNGQAYFLGITAGLGKLVIPQVQSPNFVTGVSGWIIRKNGSAEFNNVVIRGGEVISGTTLVYSGTPAPGNLELAISPNGGTDAYGNSYPAGFSALNGTEYVNLSGGELTFDNGGFISESTNYLNFGGVPLNILTPISSILEAVKPGTTSTGESWHNMTLINGWEAGTGVTPKYRYVVAPQNSVEVIGSLNGAAETSSVFAELPTGYIPADVQMFPLSDTTLATAGQCYGQCDASGNLTVNCGTLINRYTFHGYISLDA
jgi:hypothetical protein